MDLEIRWLRPLKLRDGHRLGLIYHVPEQEAIPEEPGIYVFARKYGNAVVPLYIGQAEDLRRRVGQHLTQNVRLMKGIETADNGKRMLYLAEFLPRPGQSRMRPADGLTKRHCP